MVAMVAKSPLRPTLTPTAHLVSNPLSVAAAIAHMPPQQHSRTTSLHHHRSTNPNALLDHKHPSKSTEAINRPQQSKSYSF